MHIRMVTISGVYTINPDNQIEFKVYTDGGGWTVIQCRCDGSVSFDRNWTDCESGFGNETGEYWLGLSYVHASTDYQCITESESRLGRL